MIYTFEEIGPDLAQPPLAARRALMSAGISVPQNTWLMLPVEARRGIVEEGARDYVNDARVHSLVSPVLKNLRLLGPVKDPSAEIVPDKLQKVLAGIRPISAAEWSRLRPLDRFSLNVLSGNSRLLWRAIAELGQTGVLGAAAMQTWVGPLGHCELRALPNVLAELAAERIQGGKAVVIARAAGLRAARAVSSTLDAYADRSAGPIELDARVDPTAGVVVWQAHVSTTEGEFFGAAALLAATTAAIALRDALATLDPSASLADGSLREEPWTVGSGTFGEDATVVTSDTRAIVAQLEKKRQQARAQEAGSVPLPSSPNAPSRAPVAKSGAPMWMLVAMLIVTLLSLASAVVALALKRPA